MKKLIDRIHRWMIRKLDGYIAPLPSEPVEVAIYTRDVVRLCWECKIPAGLYLDRERPEQEATIREIDTVAKKNLAEQLFNGGFVNVQTYDTPEMDPFSGKRMRYTIIVAKP